MGTALAVGALAINRLAITLAVKQGLYQRLAIEDLEVGPLRARELITDSSASSSGLSSAA